MTRKTRKQIRKQKSKQSKQDKKLKKLDKLARYMAKVIANDWHSRDTSNYGKIVKVEGKKACYDYVGGIALCSECFAKEYCSKWEDGIEDYIRSKK